MSRTRQTPFTDPAEFSDNPRPVVTLANDYPSGYEIEPHRHARAQLVYAAQGVMTVTVAAGSWVVPPQRAVWMPAGTEHAIRINRSISMRSLFIRPAAAAGLHAIEVDWPASNAVAGVGLTDAYRAFHPEAGRYTYWDYQGGAWQKDFGLRIDHLLLSPQAADLLTASEIDRAPRNKEKPSDHTPIWCELQKPGS